MKRIFSRVCMAAALFSVAGSAMAHHSPAIFDRTKEVKLVGVVKEFRWANPHSSIELAVPNNSGSDSWAIEMGSPNELVKAGWKSTTIKSGDPVTIMIHPLHTDEKAGQFVSITLKDGRVLKER
jgi:uncharacterized protein DUF6152